MREIDWSAEPNLEALRKAHAQLTTDPEGAMNNLEDLAAQGSRMSMWYLAHTLSAGPSIPHDLVRARHWYQQAAKNGDVEALHMVGRVSLDLEELGRRF